MNYPALNRISADVNSDFRKYPDGNKPTATKGNNTPAPLIKDDVASSLPDEEGQTISSKNNPALKIGITGDGICKITCRDLVRAGWNVSGIDPRNISMQHLEKEIPIIVSGEADGVFHPNDYLLFYGVSNKDIYTNKNVYWLKAGNQKGKRMATKNGAISGNDVVPDGFPAHPRAY